MKKTNLTTVQWLTTMLAVISCSFLHPALAQNGVRIAATQGTADPSAMLDVVSTSKGLLVPRMSLSEKNGIVNPANGLLVYQTDGSVGYYYNSGTPSSPVWVQLSAGALSGTGTNNTVAKWTSTSGLGNSSITDDGSSVVVGGSSTTVTNLAGTGLRTVYANNTGRLMTTPPTVTVFTYTGADQTYTVPAGATSITIKLWGAGGGGGNYGGWSNGWSGGGGGFTQGVLAVTAGQTFTVMVGGGGLGGNSANTAWSYGGGARSCNISDCRYGGQGGGRSAFRSGGTELLTAGGGGGGGSTRGAAMNQMGGAGGGTFGQQGMSAHYNYGAGAGGGPIAGGAGGSNVAGVGVAGSQFTGGQPGSNAYGGGGGGGWFGGGGGGYNEDHTMAGGGGGSGYIGGAGITNGFTKVGFYNEPANQQDIHYAAGAGVGGLTQGTSTPVQGGHGRVVIIVNN